MVQISDKNSFQIILQSDEVDNLSEYWQDQCKYLYDEIYMTLPEGSIKPLTLKGAVGEKAVDITLFSQWVVDDITAKLFATLFVETLIEAFKWCKHIQHANVTVKYPDESILKVSQQFLAKLLEYSKENPQLSIFEVLNHFKNLKE